MNSVHKLKQLSEFSSTIGRNILLTQGPGGNTSVKCGNTLWVKASGMWLANAATTPIFCSVDLTKIHTAIEHDDSGQELERVIRLSSGALRPSIETSLHALIPHTVVIHVHAIDPLAWLVQRSSHEMIEILLDGLNWRWVPYRRPGTPLTIAIQAVLNSSPDILMLANHGIVVGGRNVEQVGSLLEDVVERLAISQRPVNPTAYQYDEAEMTRIGTSLKMHAATKKVIQSLANDPISFTLLEAGILYPDQAVFLGARAAIVRMGETPEEIVAAWSAKFDMTPDYLVLENRGVLVANDANTTLEEMLAGHALLLLRLDIDTDLRPLSSKEIAALLNWDAEVYRQTLDSRSK